MAQKVTDDIKLCFSKEPQYKFDKVAGQGGSGIALCFKDTQATPDEFSRFIVKTIVLGNETEIINELRWLKRLRWTEHIVMPVYLDPDPLGKSFEKPTLVIEYLESGTLDAFLNRRRAAGLRRLPNRVLWAIFLCLVRACVAMANPPHWIPNSRSPREKRRETLPALVDLPSAGNLIHSDMNFGNLMFGDKIDKYVLTDQQPDTEHHLVPTLKLMDFGDAYEITNPEALPQRRDYDRILNLAARMEDDLRKLQNMGKPPIDGREKFRNVAIDMNILETGVVMGRLMTNDFTNPQAAILREIILEKYDDMATLGDPNLDHDLFWLVARCLAFDPDLRPRLSHLLDLVEIYATTKTYGNIAEESNVSIRQMIQRFIFDVYDQGAASGTILASPASWPSNSSIMELEDSEDNPIILSTNVSPVKQGDSIDNPIELDSEDSSLL